ncbi:hypothetical protein HUJ05_003875 [Dendroctonus ponderosae]|nr:hypothetical protein HUJ05_003875 [Dendroctonus ponderosae]
MIDVAEDGAKSTVPSHSSEEINTGGTPTAHYYKPIVIAEAIYYTLSWTVLFDPDNYKTDYSHSTSASLFPERGREKAHKHKVEVGNYRAWLRPLKL